jgi:hypothetical protein
MSNERLATLRLFRLNCPAVPHCPPVCLQMVMQVLKANACLDMSVPPDHTKPTQLHIAHLIMSSGLDLDSFREQTAVDRVNNWLGTDLPSTKESSVEAFDGILASLYAIKLQVDVTLGVWIESNVGNMAVLFLTFSFDIIFKLLRPGIAFFSAQWLAKY